MYSRRLFDSSIKSVLHFDFPHANARIPGLHDEVGLESWNKAGNACFVSRFKPADITATNAPKFGYRSLCTQSASDYVYSTGNSGIFSFTSSVAFNLEIWTCLQSSTAGNIFAFMNGSAELFTVSVTAERKIKVVCSTLSINFTTSDTLPLNDWAHVRVGFSRGNGYVTVFINGTQCGEAYFTEQPIAVTSLRIGGANAYFDEFIFRHNNGGHSVTSSPVQGSFDIAKAGGYGTGADGELSITSGTKTLNICAIVKSASGSTVKIADFQGTGAVFPSINPGDEVLFLVMPKSKGVDSLAGLYAFRRVVDCSSGSLTLDSPVSDEFNMSDALNSYKVTVHRVPNLSGLTLAANASLRPDFYRVLTFRCTGNVTWHGKTALTSITGRTLDNWDLCHSDLPDRMIYSSHNIFITCGGTFTADSSARIGGNSSLTRKGGYGGVSTDSIMVGSSNYYEDNILIAARKLSIDDDALAYGARGQTHYSGLCYLAGELI